jgi:hypothetical protein
LCASKVVDTPGPRLIVSTPMPVMCRRSSSHWTASAPSRKVELAVRTGVLEPVGESLP